MTGTMDSQHAAMARSHARMHRVDGPGQLLGRIKTIGCVALEITQRCNLDCAACYLSEHAEQVRDVPVEVLLTRLDAIVREYGPGTNVQITGGEPTLRKRGELVAIVRHAARIGLMPALFTNGIAATRELLAELAGAGLADVAFHVDLTQGRRGYASERDLNAVRLEYLARARGLGLMVVFNTTVCAANLAEVPALVRFFATRREVGFASFQVHADTGRGALRRASDAPDLAAVRAAVDVGAGRALAWDVLRVGHPRCHSFAPCLVAGGRIEPLVDDAALVARVLARLGQVPFDRRRGAVHIVRRHLAAALRHPALLGTLGAYAMRRAWRARRALLSGRVHKLSLFVHHFMDATSLDPERLEACSFMVAGASGPVSMCAHNARRDEHVLKPFAFERAGRVLRYRPHDPGRPRLPRPVAAEPGAVIAARLGQEVMP